MVRTYLRSGLWVVLMGSAVWGGTEAHAITRSEARLLLQRAGFPKHTTIVGLDIVDRHGAKIGKVSDYKHLLNASATASASPPLEQNAHSSKFEESSSTDRNHRNNYLLLTGAANTYFNGEDGRNNLLDLMKSRKLNEEAIKSLFPEYDTEVQRKIWASVDSATDFFVKLCAKDVETLAGPKTAKEFEAKALKDPKLREIFTQFRVIRIASQAVTGPRPTIARKGFHRFVVQNDKKGSPLNAHATESMIDLVVQLTNRLAELSDIPDFRN